MIKKNKKKTQKNKQKKKVVLYRINILLFNKDIYVIRNFALGRCWPEKSRFLCDLTLASPGALNLLWKQVAVTLSTGEWGLWCGEGVHCVVSAVWSWSCHLASDVTWRPPPALHAHLCMSGTRLPEHYFMPPSLPVA